VVVATGVLPRTVSFPGADHPRVVPYPQVLDGSVTVGRRVAVVGAGGIGVDVSHFLSHDESETREDWFAHWGVADPALHPGGLGEKKPRVPAREVYLLQRKTTAVGKDLAKTSGWAHRAVLRDSGVQMVPGVTYDRVDDDGLHITVGDTLDEPGERRLLDVDHVVVCAGQVSARSLYDDLQGSAAPVHLVGGAEVAAELDAKRAIEQGTRVAARL
jgi:2,4-dienoyl-CoA reductase (NADPH2)